MVFNFPKFSSHRIPFANILTSYLPFADGLEKSEMIQPIRLEKLIARRPEELSKPIIKLQKYCDGPQSNAMGHDISAQIGNIISVQKRNGRMHFCTRPFGDLQPSGTRNRLTEVAWVRSPAIKKYIRPKEIKTWAVVVAQLAEQSIAILEVHGLNPVIGKIL